MHNYLKAIITWAKLLKQKYKGTGRTTNIQEEFKLSENVDFCHKDKVHVFVRGLADGKLHSAKYKNYSDVRFYKKANLKIFCATCRKRII